MSNRNAPSARQWILLIAGLFLTYLLLGREFFLGLIKTELTGVGLAAGVVFLVFFTLAGIGGIKRLLRKMYPVDETGLDRIEPINSSRLKSYQLIAELLLLAGFAAGGIIVYLALRRLTAAWFQRIPGPYVVPIDPLYWLLPTFFFAALVGGCLSSLGLRIILRNKYESYARLLELSWEFSRQKFLCSAAALAIFLFVTTIYIGLSSYTRFGEEGITLQRPLPLAAEFYPYSQVAAVQDQIRPTADGPLHTLRITFIGGRRWQPMPVTESNMPGNYPLLLQYVSEKSGVPLTP